MNRRNPNNADCSTVRIGVIQADTAAVRLARPAGATSRGHDTAVSSGAMDLMRELVRVARCWR